jgi:transposase
MPPPLKLHLTDAQRAALLKARDHHPKPYIREQSAALLRVADGQSLRQVSAAGILKPRRRETIKLWIDRFLADGIAGLLVKPGRGRKPAFSPSPHYH